jgi:hypothetical protein
VNEVVVLEHRQGSQFLERPRVLTARLDAIHQQAVPTAAGHAEQIAAQMNFANAGVPHVGSAGAVTNVRARPQLTETAAGGRQLVDQLCA